MIKKSQIKNLARRILSIGLYAFDTSALLFLKGEGEPTNKSAIVRLDNIGDWILFQNVITEYVNSLSPQSVDVYVNKACASLVRKSERIEYKFIDIRKIQTNLLYRFQTIKKLCKLKYNLIINPTFSRNIRTSDSICRYLVSDRKVCVLGDDSNSSAFELELSKKWYSEHIMVNCGHEIDINNTVMTSITGLNAPDEFAKIDVLQEKFDVPSVRYVVFFIGTSQKGKTWPAKKFGNVANHILKNTNLCILLCGSVADIKYSADFMLEIKLKDRVYNIVAMTTLGQLIYVIKHSVFLVTGDTLATHIAANLGKPQVCISGLGQPGRFIPYPAKYGIDKYVVINEPCSKAGCNWVCSKSNSQVFPCVNNVSASTVISVTDSFITDLVTRS